MWKVLTLLASKFPENHILFFNQHGFPRLYRMINSIRVLNLFSGELYMRGINSIQQKNYNVSFIIENILQNPCNNVGLTTTHASILKSSDNVFFPGIQPQSHNTPPEKV